MYYGTSNPVKRRVFISHYRGNRPEVDKFIDDFANLAQVFTPYVLGANDNDDFIDSTDTDYVMTRIRQKYMLNTTVTIVLLGSCTHSRRYVDWELKTSLRQGENYTPNGVMSIILPSCSSGAYLPPRLQANWVQGHIGCYARHWAYPSSPAQLREWIEDAYDAKTRRAHLISNSQDMMKNNHKCRVCGVTH